MNSVDIVTNYLMSNYYDDVERMARIKMVGALANKCDLTVPEAANIIDKVALFNHIEKSYQPTAVDIEIASRQIIEGINFIMYREEEDDPITNSK